MLDKVPVVSVAVCDTPAGKYEFYGYVHYEDGTRPVSYTHLDVYKRQQFDCMAKYLSWDMLFKKSYYATARDELEKNKDSMLSLIHI